MELNTLRNIFKNIDWILFCSVILVAFAGLITMNSFVGPSSFFERQTIWLVISTLSFFGMSLIDWGFLKNTRIIMILFAFSIGILFLLFSVGSIFRGAQSWFSFGAF